MFVWTITMAYGYDSGRVFTLEASTESPGPDREFLRFGGEGIEVLYDPGERGTPEAYENPHVAIYMGKPGETVADPYFSGEGPDRTGCNMCGACMTGCKHNAKNSLDKNYLHLARKRGLTLKADTEVVHVRPLGDGDAPPYELRALEGASWFGRREVRYRAHVAFSTAYDLVTKMEKINNRRKAVVYVSNGYDFNPFPDARAGGGILGSNQFNNSSYQEGDMFNMDRSSQQFADADLARELSDLTRAANRANTSFYTIDPRGLVGGPDLDEKVDPVEWGNYVRKSQDSLRVIAEETGGYAVVNQNDFDKALKRIDAETSDYYVIGYYSTNPDPTKRNRRIEVRSKRPNINVWARNSYSLKPTPKPKKR